MKPILYPHNRSAYQKAVAMMNTKGKAAVIHPTGTGKSFIGFMFCFDHPDKRICWLAPSEYIFRTQLENLREAADGQEPENITFMTYARLANLPEEALRKIQPDIIVLDEFHRCGAEIWGAGVERLLGLYKQIPLLGLSATAIRYLDNQRNMADELFDGNVASEMTLGEAIVKGILNPPKYVLSVYSYVKSLETYEQRIQKLHYRGQREKAERCLDTLRRSLEQAEGMDVLFDQYMTDRTGKYLVFCADYEAMEKSREWFHLVDPKPHLYSVYSDDPEAAASFHKFKTDDDDSHLRLLFCIDALNEGVHVEGVSGVILLRPTVSPIVYKQQIGRTLSAGGSIEPVIFDIVGNIENLYAIDCLREEMEATVSYIHWNREDSQIVNERFEVLGELRNCLELFRELEGILSSSWEIMYLEAQRYYEQNGNLLVTQRYVSDAGYPIGRWLHTQRQNRKQGDSSLTEERIKKLDAIGMDWQYAEERAWKKGYEAARAFYETNGHLDIPAAYVTEDGYHLGVWYRNIRNKYQEGRLEEGYIEALEGIGMKWESVLARKWQEYYLLAAQYAQANGSLDVPLHYRTETGVKLGVWISTQRESYSKGRLKDVQIAMLEQIGMSWDRFDSKWDRGFDCAVRYKEEYGDINTVPEQFELEGVKLLSWIRAQRARYHSGKLASDRIARLETIGIIWNPQEALWEKGYAHAVSFAKEHGDLEVPSHYVCEDGYKLKSWLNNQGTRYKNGRLTDEQRKRLEAIGMKWGTRKERKAG